MTTTFTGTAGDDSLVGTSGQDIFHLEDGGADTAQGGAGRDIFYIGATLTADDHIDGGPGGGGQDYDTVILDGDYSEGLVCTDSTLSNIEQVQFVTGHDYNITLNANLTFAYFQALGGELGSGDCLTLDISRSTVENVTIEGGAGADLLMGGGDFCLIKAGGGADTIIGGHGRDTITVYLDTVSVFGGDGDDVINGFTDGVVIDGGDRSDTLNVYGGFSGATVTLGPARILNIETFNLGGGSFTIEDGLAASGNGLLFDATHAPNPLDFDGSREAADPMRILGSQRNDTLIGGGGSDTIVGAKGDNTMIGGGGDDELRGFSGKDKLVGGLGADLLTGGFGTDRFFYLSSTDSIAEAPDLITDITNIDVLYLKPIDADATRPGNQAFHLVKVLDGHAGELALHYDKASKLTAVEGDVNGDGVADLTIELDGSHAKFDNFVL